MSRYGSNYDDDDDDDHHDFDFDDTNRSKSTSRSSTSLSRRRQQQQKQKQKQQQLRVKPRSTASASSSVASTSSSTSSSTSLRVRRRRAHKQQQQQQEFAFDNNDDDLGSIKSRSSNNNNYNNTNTNNKVSIKGAGTSALAVQDAGTYQMLHDECTYLCSTITMSRTPSQAMDAAIDLAILLSNRNTRSVLWQGGGKQQQQQQQQSHDNDDEFEEPQSTVFRTVLDVLAKATVQPQKQQQRNNTTTKPSIVPNSSSNSSSKNNKPTRFRTKSARKRIKQSAASVCGSDGGATQQPNATTMIMMSTEMRQVLASILCFLSWDCTMCDKNSVAAMGIVKSVRLARKLRLCFLEHGDALQAILNLMATEVPSSSSSSSLQPPDWAPSSSSLPGGGGGGSSSYMSSSSSSSRYRRRYNNASVASTPSIPVPVVGASSPMSSTGDSLSLMGTVSSVSFEKDDFIKPPPPPPPPPKPVGDPTAAGRRNRRRQRLLQSVLETNNGKENDQNTNDDTAADADNNKKKFKSNNNNNNVDDLDFDFGMPGTKVIPPPAVKRQRRRYRREDNKNDDDDDGDLTFTSTTSSTTTDVTSNNNNNSSNNNNDNNTFTAPISPTRKDRILLPDAKSPDDTRSVASSSIGSVVTSTSSSSVAAILLSAKATQKLTTLLSKVDKTMTTTTTTTNLACQQHSSPIEHDLPWVSMICLESFQRIVTGKGGGGGEDTQSCLESESDDEGNDDIDDDDDALDEHDNPIMTTNRLLSKSRVVIPMLGRIMGRSLQAVYDLMMRMQQQQNGNGNGNSDDDDPYCRDCWAHWERRISILAELLDGACLFHKSNRTAFCESDPFLFDARNGGLIFYIVVFLKRCSRRLFQSNADNNNNNNKLSGIMLLALRTLTSLTHDNELAAEQMTVEYPLLSSWEDDYNDDNDDEGRRPTVRGVDVLAELVYELEQDKVTTTMTDRKSSIKHDDEALHRFDCTIFCLNTLANIIEAGAVRCMLAEIEVVKPPPSSTSSTTSSTTSSSMRGKKNKKKKILWLKWLCHWLVSQTESFQDAIFGIGKKRSEKRDPDRELQKHEDDRLVAAGNGCVLLACMMQEPEEISEEPEYTNTIRKLIVDELPRNEDGKAGYILIINTLKAFCNFYHFSLGDLSVAIVTPVKKLIVELQELEREERMSRS